MSRSRALGAFPDADGGTTFRAWTTTARGVAVRLYEDADRATATVPLQPSGSGFFEARVPGVGAGALYKLVLDERALPDPYARFLPHGVHGPAEVVARMQPAEPLPAVPLGRMVIYELHVGTFTPEGTYGAATDRLRHLANLGVTAIELMPLSSAPGTRGWGYDGVAHFAPFAPYGRPEALRAFVERAHALGIAVLLDVVFNHFGPRGNYLGAYAPEYFARTAGNQWGSTPDFGHPMVRAYALENARMWLEEYGFDGLRLDATHAIVDPTPVHVLRELHDLAASLRPARVLVAEDERNDPDVLGAWGMDAVWADDFHHQMHVLLTGEHDGYYEAYEPTLEALARTIERGWIYEGQPYAPWGRPRGRSAAGIARERLVYCVQNHDQVGNRAFGTRLDHDSSVDALRAATQVLLFLPSTPMLFMGQEWAASSPFLFFSDHDPDFGPLVSRGRREEFARFRAFSDPAVRERIPDPQSFETFERSKLRWEEIGRDPHRGVLEAVRAMLRTRREDPVLAEPNATGDVRARVQDGLLVVERSAPAGHRVLLANLAPEPRGGLRPFGVVVRSP